MHWFLVAMLEYFFPFWFVVPRKICQPCPDPNYCNLLTLQKWDRHCWHVFDSWKCFAFQKCIFYENTGIFKNVPRFSLIFIKKNFQADYNAFLSRVKVIWLCIYIPRSLLKKISTYHRAYFKLFENIFGSYLFVFSLCSGWPDVFVKKLPKK
jgi:hypothetical protein